MNTIYNTQIDKIYTTPNVYHYIVTCANSECSKSIRVKKGTWEKILTASDPTILTCSRTCKNSKHVYNLTYAKKLKKYGCGNPFENPVIQAKIKETLLHKYGSENISQTDHFKTKSKETFLKNFGYDNPQKCPEINKKTAQTRNERYGDDLVGWAVKSTMFKTNLERYGNEWYFGSDVGKQTLENFIKRYGPDEGAIRWNAKIESGKQTLENFIKRYGVQEGNLRYNNWKSLAAQTLENFINRHGEINGHKLYEQYRIKCLKNLLKNGSRSKLNDDFEEILLTLTSVNNIHREFPIKTDRLFLYDFYIRSKNIIIEVHGDYWHCNPTKYSSGQMINWPGKKDKVLVDTVWERDILKREIAIQHGIKYYHFWEYDIRNNKQIIKTQLKELIEHDTTNKY